MASGQTENYGLNQWAAEDAVLREEFNRDNVRIGQAITDMAPKYAIGSYVGTGEYGAEHPVKLTFDFAPQFVVVLSQSAGLGTNRIFLIRGCAKTSTMSIYTQNAVDYTTINVLWEDNSVSWYLKSYGDDQSSAKAMANSNGSTYSYFALG